MTVSRRNLLRTTLFGTIAGATAPALAQSAPRAASAAPLGSLGLEASQYGLRPGSTDDQSRTLQNALVEAVRHALAAGGADLAGTRGQGCATRRRRSDLVPCWRYAGAERPSRAPA